MRGAEETTSKVYPAARARVEGWGAAAVDRGMVADKG